MHEVKKLLLNKLKHDQQQSLVSLNNISETAANNNIEAGD